MTARWVASSSLEYSLHFMVCAFAGAGTSGTSVFPGIGKPGIPGKPGNVRQTRDAREAGFVRRGCPRGDAIGGPGSVVIATVPGVVREHPVARPTNISAAAVTRRWVLICATIGARAT